MKVSLNLCLLFTLISPVVLLTCNLCLNIKGTTCSRAFNENCFPYASCKNFIFNSNALNVRLATKSCINPTRCDPGYYSITTSGGGFLKMLVDCCTTDNCNSRDLEFPSEPMEPNGLECEGCYMKHVSECNGVEMVKCLGDQTKCISMKITYAEFGLTQFSIKGCATPLMCDPSKVKNNMDLGSRSVHHVTANCTDARLSPEPSSLA